MVHLQENGFEVIPKDVSNEELSRIKAESGITPELSGCHTAFIGDQVIEGHVPASSIRRMLAESPGIRGLAVPGMPAGSPGMEGSGKEPYSVLSLDQHGGVAVFERH